MTGNSGNLVNDANRLVEASANGRRARQVVDAKLTPLFGIVGSICIINGLLEAKVLVAQGLHHYHCLSAPARRVGIALTKNAHDGNATSALSIDPDAAEEPLREPSPARKALLADGLYLSGVKQTAAGWTEFILELLLENRAILEERTP